MARSKWKGFFFNDSLLKCFKEFTNKNLKKKKKFLVIQRNAVIHSKFLNTKVAVYNGKSFINIFIDSNKIGSKFGEFVFTRKRCIHKKKKKIKSKK
jgi:ribosomal protein S19